jgi:hypothetical protein
LDTEPVSLRVQKNLNEDFTIFSAYAGGTPAEIIRQLMREWVENNRRDKRAMEFYARKKGQTLLPASPAPEAAANPA